MTDSPRPSDATPPRFQTPDEIEAALSQTLSLIATAERLSKNHQVVNLSKLDARVAEICASVAALPSDVAQTFAPHLSALVKGLDRLEAVTREAHRIMTAARGSSVAPQLDSSLVSDATRASAAYARALATDPTASIPDEPSSDGNRRRVERRDSERRLITDRRLNNRRDELEDE